MSLVAKLTKFCSHTPLDYRSYVELIKADDPAFFDQLQPLLLRLQKSSSDVAADKELFDRVLELRSFIGAGRAVSSFIADDKAGMAAFDAETRRMLDERESLRLPLQREMGKHLNIFHRAEDAIDQLNKIITDNPELMRDERAATLDDIVIR